MFKSLIEWWKNDFSIIATGECSINVNWYDDDEYLYSSVEQAIFTFYIGNQTGKRKYRVVHTKDFFNANSSVKTKHQIYIWIENGTLPSWATKLEK